MTDSMLIHGRYHLLEQIGRGGMGQVWRARDEALGREVAVKCLKPLGSQEAVQGTEGVRERFRREARVAAGLQHRGITVVHDFGEYDGVLYLVMEFLAGRNLSELLTDRNAEPLPEAKVADIAEQTVAALAYTHGRGIVHRDLKPANLILLDDGTVKICDFGIARLVHDIGLGAKLTTAGMAMGTPHYMSPEQIVGSQVDARSDLYSLGCVLYELVTGAPPFDLGDPWAILIGHRDTPPEPLRALRPELSAELDELILGLLAKDPDQRPEDAASRARDVARAAGPGGPAAAVSAIPAADPVPAATPRAPDVHVTDPPATPEPQPVTAETAGTLAPVVSSAGAPAASAKHHTNSTPEPEPALGPADRSALRPVPPTLPDWARFMRAGISAGTVRAAATGGPAVGEWAALTGQWTGLSGSQVERSASDSRIPSQRQQDALPATLDRSPAEELRQALAGRHSAGVHLGRLGRWSEALQVHQQLLVEREQALGSEHPDTVESRYETAGALARHSRWEDALGGYGRVADTRARQLGPRHPDTLAARYEAAVALGKLGRPAEALELYRELVAARTHSRGRSHPETLRARHGLGVSLGRLGRWEEALAEARDVCALRTASLGAEHPRTMVSHREIAIALAWLGRWEEALAEYRLVRVNRERELGPGHPDALGVVVDEVHCLEQLGRQGEAAELQRQAEHHRWAAQSQSPPTGT